MHLRLACPAGLCPFAFSFPFLLPFGIRHLSILRENPEIQRSRKSLKILNQAHQHKSGRRFAKRMVITLFLFPFSSQCKVQVAKTGQSSATPSYPWLACQSSSSLGLALCKCLQSPGTRLWPSDLSREVQSSRTPADHQTVTSGRPCSAKTTAHNR